MGSDATCRCGSAAMMPKEQIMEGLTVPLTVVTSRTEAELITGLLRSNGLRAAVSADDAGGQDPQLPLEGVRVLVAPLRRSRSPPDPGCGRSRRPVSGGLHSTQPNASRNTPRPA
jgi:hypothetical protein